jgi:hypothetical protein
VFLQRWWAGGKAAHSFSSPRKEMSYAGEYTTGACKGNIEIEKHGHLARILEARDGTMTATDLGGGDLEVELAGEDAFLA